jgi:hypothetical protein
MSIAPFDMVTVNVAPHRQNVWPLAEKVTQNPSGCTADVEKCPNFNAMGLGAFFEHAHVKQTTGPVTKMMRAVVTLAIIRSWQGGTVALKGAGVI